MTLQEFVNDLELNLNLKCTTLLRILRNIQLVSQFYNNKNWQSKGL